MTDIRNRLKISKKRLDEINAFLLDPENDLINEFLSIVEKYGGPREINRKAAKAGKLNTLLSHLKKKKSPYVNDLKWLMEQRDNKAFISANEYQNRFRKDGSFNERNAVTLEISALQYFPWLIEEARHSIESRQLMPGRFIRVRNMKEQVEDDDILAVAAAMVIIGASCVETLDTRGTDGSNVHLGGPSTITGYFGGIGSPNDYPLKWLDEYLYYYTTYGIRQVLNTNPGTVFLGYMLHKLGIENEFKISVFMGNDNPFAVLWTLMASRLLSRQDGTTSLIGFNFSNSVNNKTIRNAHEVRKGFGLENGVRFEHHITETWKSIVRQPYNRRDELIEIAAVVPNISAKHEGGDPEVESRLDHPSDILDYFMPKKEAAEKGLLDAMFRNYLEKHNALNKTAEELIRAGIAVKAAGNLH
ncbi:MAG: hypothetical protein AB1659_11725 [Thermodesulfobacteriota bacterium]